MMQNLNRSLVAIVAASCLVSTAWADEAMAKKEGRKCTACHSREPGNKTLTPKGEALKGKGVTMEHFGKTEPKK